MKSVITASVDVDLASWMQQYASRHGRSFSGVVEEAFLGFAKERGMKPGVAPGFEPLEVKLMRALEKGWPGRLDLSDDPGENYYEFVEGPWEEYVGLPVKELNLLRAHNSKFKAMKARIEEWRLRKAMSDDD